MIHSITDSDNPSNHRRNSCKIPWDNTLVWRFLLGIWFHIQRKNEANTSSVWSPPKKVTAIMILYKNTEIKIRSPDGDIDFFDIVVGVLHRDTLDPYLFIICLDYALRMSIDLIKENGFTLKKARSRWHPAETITDADYADDIALLANTPTQAKFLLHSLEQSTEWIGFQVDAEKTEYMCFNREGDMNSK